MNRKKIIYFGIPAFAIAIAAAILLIMSGGEVSDEISVPSETGDMPHTTTEGLMSEEFPLPLSEDELNGLEPSAEPASEEAEPVSTPTNEPIPTTSSVLEERFVVALKSTQEDVAAALVEKGFVTDKEAFLAAFEKESGAVAPGGYHLSKDMSPAEVAEALRAAPYMKWVIIPEGLRKEEVADILGNALGWSADTEEKWISVYSRMKYDYVDGVYFPDTYLLPVAESPLDTTNRILAKFNEKFAPYLPQFAAQNIKWTTGLTLASIVQREAASNADMPLIAGILWNRLEAGMTLGVDATLQYVRGDTGKGWWAPASAADKKLDSPYNTYIYKGLPPHPISNPGIPAIEAVLEPAETDCLYYLHDDDRVTHCAATYEGHLDNIEKYLK